MALVHSFESVGNKLFRYRGQIPVLFFLIAIPFIAQTDPYELSRESKWIWNGAAIFLSFLGLYIRAIAIGKSAKNTSGRNTKKQVAESLNTKGIYSMVRHPLYLGNYFMWIGIVVYTYNIYLVILCTLIFWIYYERIMFAEERFLERKFGQAYVDWSKKIPAFIPSLNAYEPTNIKFSWKTIFRREYSGVTATILGFAFVDLMRQVFFDPVFKVEPDIIITIAVALAISFIFRTLKHHTKVLHEEDRS